jgi:outer membrane protein OmpA-like peptidoglycan-associated protein
MTSRLTDFLSVLLTVLLVQGAQTLAPTLTRAQSDTSSTSRINFDDLTADADKPLFLRYGIFGGVNFNYHNVNFVEFAGVPTCCSSNYSDASIMSWHGGFLFESPFTGSRLGWSVRASYTNLSIALSKTEPLNAQTLTGPQPVPIQHTKNLTLGLLGLEPMLTYRVLDGLTLYAGIRAGYFLQRSFDYVERIPDTTLINFLVDGQSKQTRNVIPTREIPNMNTINLSLLGGISYEIPLDANGKWLVAPEAFFAWGGLPLGNLTQPAANLISRIDTTNGRDPDARNRIIGDGSWFINNLRVSLSLRYSPFRTIRPELTPALQETIKQIKKLDSAISVERVQNAKRLQQVDSINKAITVKVAELKKVGISVNISKIVGVDADGREIPNPKLVIEQFRKSVTQPILPAVFFDESSFTFPSRYRRLKAADRNTFKLSDVGGKSNLEAYRQLLNVVGKRMEDNAAAVLFLTGCNANVGPEAGNQKLSEQRAQAISDYLQDVWKIPTKRIIIQKRDLPENPASSADANGAAENRRVDMSSNLPEIFAPFKTDQIARIANPPIIRFGLEINAGAGLKQWNLEVTQFADDESVTLKEASGTNTYPPQVDWRLDLEPNTVPVSGQDLTVQLGMTDISNKNGDAPLASIPVEQINIQKKELDGKADKRIDVYDIIGFTNGANPALDEINQKTLTDLKAALKPNATVVINAYSENVGDAAQNKQFAQKRADLVAKTLGVANAKINVVGPTTIHDNQAAEGRIYNRFVRVEVQTPTK